MASWHYGWEFTQTIPTFPSYVLSSVQWIHPSLSRFIPENKLLASVPCFQKIRLLFTNDLYFLTITCRPSRFFFLFPFCFIFIYSQNYTPVVLYEEKFLCTSTFLYMTNLFCTHIRTLLFTSHGLYTNRIYIQRSFSFFSNAHLWLYNGFFIYTRCSHTQEFLYTYFL